MTNSDDVPGLVLLKNKMENTSAEVFPLPHPHLAAIMVSLLDIALMIFSWSSFSLMSVMIYLMLIEVLQVPLSVLFN